MALGDRVGPQKQHRAHHRHRQRLAPADAQRIEHVALKRRAVRVLHVEAHVGPGAGGHAVDQPPLGQERLQERPAGRHAGAGAIAQAHGAIRRRDGHHVLEGQRLPVQEQLGVGAQVMHKGLLRAGRGFWM
ncbi:hypothetical protein D3C72_1992920 [compost metagenome]